MQKSRTQIGLTEESIQAAVESRLRSARLYDADASPYLYVNVNVVGRAFSARLEYNKTVYDQISTERGLATTWKIGSAGTHGRTARRSFCPVSPAGWTASSSSICA